ncbi:hypothetical protein BDZ94DRAFT_1248411 [Collybia nuda]|uniref:Uncharacterized protein n=1 Tax=Collybia nuda TaxID=64659 RepID=A0A9P6CPD5_9AGAR|nr:hypothetical protein BDZ94DRAFT_1248411 [Collybia nuda]
MNTAAQPSNVLPTLIAPPSRPSGHPVPTTRSIVMNYTRSAAFLTPSYNDFHRMSDTCADPSSSSLPTLLTVSAVLLAVDATVHVYRWRSREKEPVVNRPTHKPLTQFVTQAEKILADFQDLEKTLQCEREQSQRSEAPAAPRPELHIITGNTQPEHAMLATKESKKARTSAAFTAFCDRLLLMNKIWEQEKKMKALRTQLESKTKAKNDTAFKTFCDQLLLQNRIWKLEREVETLIVDGEKMKRSRVSAITRAAKQMVLDVQKERMIDEFVKDLIEEVGASKEEVKKLKAEHEREVAEINGDWMKDYRKITKELDALKLAQEARLVEQEVANHMEQSLYDNLQEGKKQVEVLEEKVSAYEKGNHTSYDDDTLVENDDRKNESFHNNDDEPTDVELDTISELSTSSTCVSVEHFGSNPRTIGRARRVSLGGKPSSSKVPSGTASERSLLFQPSLSSTPSKASRYSLRPLIFDNPPGAPETNTSIAAETRSCNHSGRPRAVRNRTTSLVVRPIPALRSSSSTSFLKSGEGSGTPLKKRAPWRV